MRPGGGILVRAPLLPAPRLPPTEATRRWAALLQEIFEVDPLVCPQCAGSMRIVAFITQSIVIDQILTHLRTRSAPGPIPGGRARAQVRQIGPTGFLPTKFSTP